MLQPTNVLFVCTANICRSAYAHVFAQSMLGTNSGLALASAGTWGFENAPLCESLVPQAQRNGIAYEWFRSQALTAHLVGWADLILVASREHRNFILDEWPGAFKKTFLLRQYAQLVQQITNSGHELLKELAVKRPATSSSFDIADPYRQGAEATAACAAQIESALKQIIPRLADQS